MGRLGWHGGGLGEEGPEGGRAGRSEGKCDETSSGSVPIADLSAEGA